MDDDDRDDTVHQLALAAWRQVTDNETDGFDHQRDAFTEGFEQGCAQGDAAAKDRFDRWLRRRGYRILADELRAEQSVAL